MTLYLIFFIISVSLVVIDMFLRSDYGRKL